MKKFILVLIIAISYGVLSSCEKDIGPYIAESDSTLLPIDTSSNPQQDTIPDPTIFPYTISYNNHIKQMLAQNCVQACHSPQHPKLDLRPPVSYDQLLTDGFSAPYVNTTSPDQSILYLHLAGIYSLMPQGGPKLSQGKIDSVYTWIAQGAQNN